MPHRRECCIPQCNKRQDVLLHIFPRKTEIQVRWLQAINSETLNSLDQCELRKLFVCHEHFENRFITPKSRLKHVAYPSLFTDMEISSGIPTSFTTDGEKSSDHQAYHYDDHSYCKDPEKASHLRKRRYEHSYCKDPDACVPSTSTEQSYAGITPPHSILPAPDACVPSTSTEQSYAGITPPHSILPAPDACVPSTSTEQSYAGITPPHSILPAPDACVPSTSTEQSYAGITPPHSILPAPDACVPSTSTEQSYAGITPPHSILPAPDACVPSTSTEQSFAGITPTHSILPAPDQVEPCFKTPKKGKRRVIKNVEALTPRCKLLYKEYRKSKRQSDYISRAKRAIEFTNEKSFDHLTKNMSSLSKKVLWMQVKLCTKNKQARRFTEDEKMIALAIFKQSPKSYKFLQKIFILPSKTTLKKMISQLKIEAGINPQLFGLIKEQVKNWNDNKKMCSILFDEMALEPAVTYSATKDKIDGFVELQDKQNKFADHALVFMLRGAVHKWQQPAAFYFCEGATSSQQLKPIIKEVVAAVSDAGLVPIALVSDQGSAFQSVIQNLIEDTKRDQLRAGENVDDTIHLSGHCLNVFFDAPHLIKGIRNNLLTKDLCMGDKKATWQDIVDVYVNDCNHGDSRILHKLTDQDVIPEKIKKMKVKNAVRVFSKSVSAALSYTSKFPLYPDGKPVSKTLKDTAEVVSFFDDVFDSVNGAAVIDKKSKAKDLRRAVTAKSRHHKFWTEAIKKLKLTKFRTKDGKEVNKENPKRIYKYKH